MVGENGLLLRFGQVVLGNVGYLYISQPEATQLVLKWNKEED